MTRKVNMFLAIPLYNNHMFSKNLTESYPEAIRFLTNAVLKDKLANSYIFIGKESNAILSIATNLAKILNCKNNLNSTPCETCINCKWLEKNEHPQALITINPDLKSKKDQIKIDTVRELLNNLQITSEYFRVVFFQNSNLYSLPPESCNLLLKTVEETPERTTFVFANTTRNDILPTILSRSQTIYINKKYDSILEIINKSTAQTIDSNLTNCFSNDIKTALEKAKKTQEWLEESETNLKDYLIGLATTNYNFNKANDYKRYCTLYKNLTSAYLKHKSFMQPKIVIEDLFLNLCHAI
ncbi:MAG: hypothetical protein HY094_02930 [Candidatus Melainabacteria bacterium]|nr:hypothetical protein [Candidatus Melainabacteria bacterium]